jgi:cytochrome c oxidase accessory protein FixG
VISFVIANVFLAYFIGSDQLLNYIIDGPQKHMGTLISLLIFTTIFYFIFSWFREQVCVIVCPYGRLQSVLLDNQSIVVAYDHVRGEGKYGRKKIRKNEDRKAMGHGDCIDCFQCVHVCPTGIDIRNGTQLECVNCTACIDACDDIMEKVNLPKGLIKYASEDQIVKGTAFKFTTKIKSYIAVLTILIGILGVMLTLRNDVEANVLRIRGQLYETTANGWISNVYSYKIVNKTTSDITDVTLKLEGVEGNIKLVSTKKTFTVPKQGLAEGTLLIEIPKSKLKKDKTTLRIEVYSNEKHIETTKASFIGPRTYYN